MTDTDYINAFALLSYFVPFCIAGVYGFCLWILRKRGQKSGTGHTINRRFLDDSLGKQR